MKIPLKLRFLQELTRLLETIEVAGVPMTGRVYRGVGELGDETPNPIITIIESPRPDLGAFSGAGAGRSQGWDLFIQGFAEGDPRWPTDNAYEIAAEIEVALARMIQEKGGGRSGGRFPGDYYLGLREKGVVGIEIAPALVRPQTSSQRAFCYISLRVQIAQVLGQPHLDIDPLQDAIS